MEEECMKKQDQSSRFLKRRNYDSYDFSAREYAVLAAQSAGICAAVDYLFYRSLWLLLLSVPFFIFWVRFQRRQKILLRRKTLNEQFRDALVSLNVAVQAGYSIENAVNSCLKDLRQLYPDTSDIVEEFQYIAHQLLLSIPVEELFLDMGRRTAIEDIENFAAVFFTSKRTGGDMSRIIQKVTRMLSDKIDVKKEIQATLAAKKYEQTIMSLMPAGIILYLRLASPGFLDILYGNALGIGIMSVCLAVYGGAWLLGRKIVDIEV